MSDLSLRFDPPEQTTIDQLRVGDYVTRVDRVEVRPERRVISIHRPMLPFGGRLIGLWGVGLTDGQAVTCGGDGAHIPVERLSAGEAARRDRMAASRDVYQRPDGTMAPVGRLIV